MLQPSDSTAASCSPAAQPPAELRGEPTAGEMHGAAATPARRRSGSRSVEPTYHLLLHPPTHFSHFFHFWLCASTGLLSSAPRAPPACRQGSRKGAGRVCPSLPPPHRNPTSRWSCKLGTPPEPLRTGVRKRQREEFSLGQRHFMNRQQSQDDNSRMTQKPCIFHQKNPHTHVCLL